MKKERMITRTITTLDVSVLGISDTGEVKTIVINVPVMDDKKIFPYVQDLCGNYFAPAKIVKIDTNEQLYGISESLFMQYATKLPPRGANTDNKEQE